MEKLIGPGQRQFKSETGPLLLGVDLKDAKEEIFCRMVCDGIALGVAFVRAGFKSANVNAASNLWALPRIQDRAQAILEARRTQGVVTLSEVTDMLKRVFSGAYNAEEYSAAHNAAFSLARLFGHVTDKATLEVLRRPSRDPDAPSEQALGDWVASLPVVSGPVLGALGPADQGHLAPLHSPPAAPLGHDPGLEPQSPNDINALQAMNQGPSLEARGPEGPSLGFDNDFNSLDWDTPGRSENGAPSPAVTGTPPPCGPSGLLGDEGTPRHRGSEKGAPDKGEEGTVYPRWEDLF